MDPETDATDMRICIDCQFHKRVGADVGGGKMALVDICTNTNCRDPVSGSPIPCQAARQQTVFCAFEAKYFKKKEAEPVAEKSSVIQLG